MGIVPFLSSRRHIDHGCSPPSSSTASSPTRRGLGFALGIVVAVLRMSRSPFLQAVGWTYIGLALHQAASQGRVQVERAADVVRLADRRAG